MTTLGKKRVYHRCVGNVMRINYVTEEEATWRGFECKRCGGQVEIEGHFVKEGPRYREWETGRFV